MGQTILEAKNISKSFLGVKALDGAQLTIEKGEVHALIGENGAGKSTLMNILLGALPYDSGEILWQGKPVRFHSPSDAISNGISMIHQEISLVPTMSVSENIWLGREDRFLYGGLLSKSKRDMATKELLEQFKIKVDIHTEVSRLSVATMQLVEVARAVSCHAEIIIMDEPTSALAEKEVATLFDIIRDLKSKGISIIYISHKMEELFAICDRVTVFRDGRYISTDFCAGIAQDALIKKIVGRDLNDLFPKQEAKIGEKILEVRNLCRRGIFDQISFYVRTGEILGISGLAGSGRTEIMQALFGIDSIDGGQILINSKEVRIHHPFEAVRLSMAMVTEDRLRMGALPQLSVKYNLSIAFLDKVTTKVGFVQRKRELSACADKVEELAVKISDINQQMDSLSGGNQQKVIIGRWLLTEPKIMILDEPTRGIDVGAKSEIHRLISELAQRGMAVILISSEMPEVLGMSDRILVVREGRIVHECTREDATQERLGRYALGN